MKSLKKVGALALTAALSVSSLGTNIAFAAGDYKLNKPVSIYMTAADAKVGRNPVATYSAGDYNIFSRYDGMINISKNSDPGGWINPNQATGSTSSTKYYKPSSSILVRSAKSSSKNTILGTIKKGQVISGVIDGAWIRFTFNGRTAYTAAKWYDEISKPSSSATKKDTSRQTTKSYVSSSSMLVRSAKSSSKDTILGTIKKGQVISGVIDGAWIRFTFNGRTAYTAAKWYDETTNKASSYSSSKNVSTAANYKATDYVNVRTGKSTNYQVLGTLPTGTVIRGTIENGWIKFTYNGRTAYTVAQYYNRTSESVTTAKKQPAIALTSSSSAAGKAAAIARSKVGMSYQFGSAGPYSFDCSGLTSFAYSNVGVSLPRGAQAQSRIGTTVSYNNMLPGDLIFFGSYYDTYHVAMYVGNGQIVHASTPSTGVIIDSVDNIWIRNNYYTVKRISK